ncbi:MAG: glycoside hydrolase N-terminal domain-containing protein [Lentisphaeria bacterium]
MTYSNDEIWSGQPAAIWAEGYPIGNGRLGGMVLGQPLAERVGLNHDRLWRRYWKYQDRNLGGLFPAYQQLCLAGRFAEAIALMKDKVIGQGQGIYVNPFVPVGDLGLYPSNAEGVAITDYRRRLDLATGLVDVSYAAGGVTFRREYFASWPAGVLAVRLEASQHGSIAGAYSLYRLPDSECAVTGRAEAGQLILEGRFTEGVAFAAVVRVLKVGGRFTSGQTPYEQPAGPVAPRHEKFAFGFREFVHPPHPCGMSVGVEGADAVTLLVAMTTDREAAGDLTGHCLARLDAAGEDYQQLRREQVADHQRLYNRVQLRFTPPATEPASTPERVEQVRRSGKIGPEVGEQLFNLGRYLGIAAGRPAASDAPFKAPINLQGLWNEDPRPAWDSDYHLDLNLEMCYWGLGQANLAEFGGPLVDWAFSLLSQAQHAAGDLYGLAGACYGGVNDVENLGNVDDLFLLATGPNAWLAQSLWQVWEYTRDDALLREKIYPVIREIGRFYEGLLQQDAQGRLVTAPSGSPENTPKGYPVQSILSAMSTFDIELLHELFGNLVAASGRLGVDADGVSRWTEILQKLPLPTINAEGRLLEWLGQEYVTDDPGHRHRSHLVGVCPGQRINWETAPDYAAAALKALELRHSFGGQGSCTLDVVSDAQIYARLYRPTEALGKLRDLVANHAMGNLLLCLCDWRPESGLRWFGDRRVFQVEASFGAMATVSELLLQDRGGLLRLLPALPAAWTDGEAKGLRARSGFEVDLRWAGGRLAEARIGSSQGLPCRLRTGGAAGDRMIVTCQGRPVPVTVQDGALTFPTTTGGEYVVCGVLKTTPATE